MKSAKKDFIFTESYIFVKMFRERLTKHKAYIYILCIFQIVGKN